MIICTPAGMPSLQDHAEQRQIDLEVAQQLRVGRQRALPGAQVEEQEHQHRHEAGDEGHRRRIDADLRQAAPAEDQRRRDDAARRAIDRISEISGVIVSPTPRSTEVTIRKMKKPGMPISTMRP